MSIFGRAQSPEHSNVETALTEDAPLRTEEPAYGAGVSCDFINPVTDTAMWQPV